MSTTRYTISLKVFIVNLVIVVLTAGGWLLPFGLYCVSAAVHGKKPSLLVVAANTMLSLCTFGVWLSGLIIYYLWKIVKK